MTGAADLGRVLVIDDEPQIHRFLKPTLEAAGYTVERADTGAEALRLAAGRAPDVVLLDLGLPDIDGQEVLRRLREFSAVPVIALSARDREQDKIAVLDLGADDYVEKPFGVGELLARIRTAPCVTAGREGRARCLSAGPVEIDLERRQVRVAEQPGADAAGIRAAGVAVAQRRARWSAIASC